MGEKDDSGIFQAPGDQTQFRRPSDEKLRLAFKSNKRSGLFQPSLAIFQGIGYSGGWGWKAGPQHVDWRWAGSQKETQGGSTKILQQTWKGYLDKKKAIGYN